VTGAPLLKAIVEDGVLQTNKDGSYLTGFIERDDVVAYHKTFKLSGDKADEIIEPVLKSKFVDPKSTDI
jgi:hypothetical protein